MKTRAELAGIAAALSEDVVTVACKYASKGSAQSYLYLCPRTLARTLEKGDQVLVEGARETKHASVEVVRIDEHCMVEDFTINYKWLFARVDTGYLEELRAWRERLVDDLSRAQRAQAMRALGQQFGLTGVAKLPGPLSSDSLVEEVAKQTTQKPRG